jgi:L-ascorbate metabolism protein UlaG (beta-lactamase superfamily)
MIFSRSVHFGFEPSSSVWRVPYEGILRRWIAADFSRVACKEILEEVIGRRKLPTTFFMPERILEGGMAATDVLLFPEDEGWELRFSPQGKGDFACPVPNEKVPAFAALLRWAVQTDDAALFRKRFSIVDPGFVDQLVAARPDALAPWARAEAPGIYRREHASLVIRSETTTLLLDPISLNRGLPGISAAPFRSPDEELDAIFVTHGHGDHWHIPSLLFETGANQELPVIVPDVPERSCLTTTRFADALALVDQSASAPRWGSTVVIGDIEIDILPFYGEQPTRDAPGPDPRIRSWGNCYRFNTPQFSAIVLVDSGCDPAGDMADVIRKSVRDRGPADVVLSCLRSFASPFFGGLSAYWPTLTFARMEDLFRQYKAGSLPFTTAGPSGAAELCALAGAKYFLPYAHGFQGAGVPISDIGWGEGEPSEAVALERVREAVSSLDSRCQVLDWVPGDAAAIADGDLRMLPFGKA